MPRYVAKILKISESEYKEITSPYRESKGLPPSTYNPLIEAEIICVKGYPHQIKTSCFTTIGFRSFEEVEKYRKLPHIEKDSQELEAVITLHRLIDLKAGELIEFSYPGPEGKDYNLIRYENEPLTIEDFKNKSYPSEIDNTLEDSPRRFPNFFIGISKFEKVRIHCLKEVWFRLQGRYRFLIKAKQKLFYTKRSAWEKTKLIASIVVGAIFITYALDPTLLSESKHRWTLAIATLINIVKELF